MTRATEPYTVVDYSFDALIQLLASESGASSEIVARKQHSGYFQSYFEHLGARTILVEHEYVDRDFLEDHAAYYVRCFQDYRRKCARLHFFSVRFSCAEFQAVLAGESASLSPSQLQDAYLGFVVVKPLPRTIIGRTCLKTYGSDGGRHFPIVRKYAVNLFGIELAVETLAFQEQDSVVAACATSALWSVFHGTGILFQHAIPSPVEITRAASQNSLNASRSLPNAGLGAKEMADAIRATGLEPFAVGVQEDDPLSLKASLYAYLSGRVPVLMGVRLMRGEVPWERHAVAATGFRINQSLATATTGGFQTVAQQIDKIYAHDDGIGPFARMEANSSDVSLSTSWGDNIRAVPEVLLVPLYHKIRIPFNVIQSAVIEFDAAFEVLRAGGVFPYERITWSMHLTTVNQFKVDVRQSDIPGDLKAKILLLSLPRFIWRAGAIAGGQRMFELLFDATDIEQGQFVQAVCYDAFTADMLKAICQRDEVKTAVGSRAVQVLMAFENAIS